MRKETNIVSCLTLVVLFPNLDNPIRGSGENETLIGCCDCGDISDGVVMGIPHYNGMCCGCPEGITCNGRPSFRYNFARTRTSGGIGCSRYSSSSTNIMNYFYAVNQSETKFTRFGYSGDLLLGFLWAHKDAGVIGTVEVPPTYTHVRPCTHDCPVLSDKGKTKRGMSLLGGCGVLSICGGIRIYPFGLC